MTPTKWQQSRPMEELVAIVAAVERCGSQAQAAVELGLHPDAVRRAVKRAKSEGVGLVQPRVPSVATPAARVTDSISISPDKCEITKTTAENVRTLADLIRICEIDTTEWEVERWIANKWEVGMKPPAVTEWAETKDGRRVPVFTREGDAPIVQPLFQIKAWLRRKSRLTLTLQSLRSALVGDIRAELAAIKAPAIRTRTVKSDWLFEFSPFDLHMGKFAWDEETVTNYDTKIAADLFDASLDFLLSRALKLTDNRLSRVLCVFGNDVAHIDSKRGDTTHGTHMDVDTRYIRVYRRICAVHRRAVDILRGVAPVDIVIVPGNHDELTSFHLGEILATRYEGVKHVTVNNTAKLRKYYDFGVNLFGFTHGDSEKVAELPLLMAREAPDMWTRCPSREWHIGHKHIAEKFEQRGRLEQDLFSDKGVRVRRLMSLSAHDAWHTKHAYTDRRACDAFVFHRDAGFTDHLSFNVDHFSGTAPRVA